MKKKSLFGFSAKLALMLIAICGMFASCYEKEEINVEGPSTEKPVYKIAGVVSDAVTGKPLSGATVNNTTTGADGTYEMTVDAGMNVITISKADYKTVTSSVYVETIENGKTAVYTVNAAMYPGYDDPTYKTVKYSIKGSASDTSGAAVALKSVVIAGLDNVTVSGNAFTVENVQPGNYAAVLTAEGYNKAYANIYVAPVAAQEGEGEQVAVTVATVLMQKTEAEQQQEAKYYIGGMLKDEKDAAINNATIKVTTNTGFSGTTTSDAKGIYSVEIPAKYVLPTTMAYITVSKNGYIDQTISMWVPLKESGAVWQYTGTFTMKIDTTTPPDPDQEVGGDETLEVPVEDAKPTPVEDALKDANISSSLETVAEELGIDLKELENIPTVEVKSDAVVELVSTEAVIDEETGETTGETKAVADQITIPAGTQIYYVGGKAENVSLKRDIMTEKTTAAVRTYEGQPSGAVFSKPLEIKFEAPTTVTVEPDYVLGVLYLNENTNTWKADANNYAEYDMSSKAFVGKINHFSKFRFGYVSEVKIGASADLAAEYINKPCFTGSASASVTVKGNYLGGTAYEGKTPAEAAAAALPSMNKETANYVALLLTKMIKADNANILPNSSYTNQSVSVQLTVAPYKQVKGFNLTRKQQMKTYTVHVITKDKKTIDVTVTVKKIIATTIEADLEIGHTHGHGNGQDLNAGGGIIDFE